MELYNYSKIIGENLSMYIRLKGYSKSSFSNLTGISRPTLNQILSGNSRNKKMFEEQISRITEALQLPLDFFLNEPTIEREKWRTPAIQFSDRALEGERSYKASELLADLDDLMSLSALYL